MCYHDAKDFYLSDLLAYYELAGHARIPEEVKLIETRFYHNNGFDHNLLPVLAKPDDIGMMFWGLIPWYTKTVSDAMQIRNQTLNAISEEMYEKPSYRDSLKEGKRCLVPVTGFFEWQWQDKAGKAKQPYYIHLKDQKIFSLAGIYSSWKNPDTGELVYTYSVLTTRANPLMERIHNNKKRMPVIIVQQFEKDWLNPNLTKDDVLAFCQPFDEAKMDAHTISKRITSKKDPTNVPEVTQKVDSGLLFE